MFDIRGEWDKKAWEDMLRKVPYEGPKIIKAAARESMKVMQVAMRSAIPLAITQGHSNKSIIRSVGLSVKSKSEVITTAKTGIGVNMTREDEQALFASVSRKKKAVAPHAHLYIMGTVDRWTGSKRVRNSRKTGLAGRYRQQETMHPRMFRGRMNPNRYMPQRMSTVIASHAGNVERKFIDSVTQRIGKVINGV